MSTRFQTPKVIFIGMAVFMGVITLYCLIGGITWINKPFAGILLYDFPHVSSLGDTQWSGYQAGLKFLDRIESVGGRAISRGEQFVEIIKDQKEGAVIDYAVDRKGEELRLSIEVIKFGLKDFILVFLALFLCGALIYALGLVVYILKPGSSTSWVFFLLCFCLGSYLVTSFETITYYRTVKFHHLMMCFFPPMFVHLGLIFPEKKKIVERLPLIQYVFYLPAAILAVMYQTFFFRFEKALIAGNYENIFGYEQISSFNRIFTLLCVALLVGCVLHATYKASDSLARKRAGIILFGLSMAFVPSAIVMFVLVKLKVNIPLNFLAFFVIFFPSSIAYSIVMHNLFDADTIIKRTVGYVVVTTIVIGAYVGVSLALNIVAGQYELAQSRAFPIVFTIVVILVFNPLRDRVQSLVDRIFFRKEYDYGEIVDKIGGAMTSILDMDQILRRLVDTFMNDMFIATSSILLMNQKETAYQVCLVDGEQRADIENNAIQSDNPLIGIIADEKREITKYDMAENPKYRESSEKSREEFDRLNATVLVPLVFQEKVIGLIALGEKKSGKFYNREDIDLLKTLSNQGAVAIENARLFQENLEKQRMEEELNIARDLQLSMLPSENPEIRKFGIAAISKPAMEVGGDFYDFIDIGEGKDGFIVGDVTGKSVSGALVMSASRSVFRMLSEQELNVAETMVRANRRIKKDIITGMFVALLYAVLDAETGAIKMCSAGQTQPVYLSAQTGEVKLIETVGDTFPLGILDDADYEETIVQLDPGDKIVFYTDGIVEAMDENSNMFGFDRLLEVVGNSAAMSAEELLQEILTRVDQFAGGVHQHDDITVIVVNAQME